MRVLTQGHFSKFQKGGKSCDQAKKRSISYKKTMNESTVLPSTFYPRPSIKTYILEFPAPKKLTTRNAVRG